MNVLFALLKNSVSVATCPLPNTWRFHSRYELGCIQRWCHPGPLHHQISEDIDLLPQLALRCQNKMPGGRSGSRGDVEEDRTISFYHPDIRGHRSPSLVGPQVSERDVRWQVRFQDEVEENRIISFYYQYFLMLLVHVDRTYPGRCPHLGT